VKNRIEKIIDASRKFIKTQARIIIACCHAGLFIRLYEAQFSFNFSKIRFISDFQTIFQFLSKISTHFIISLSKSSLLYNSFFSLYTKNVLGISQVNFTNQPIGNQFRVNKVHFLSLNSFLALGGIPKPNSSTLTQNFLAAAKCPHSCTITMIENKIIDVIIQRIIIKYFLINVIFFINYVIFYF
jgi:hypothetical protein